MSDPLSPDVRRIKELRERDGLGLYEARNFVRREVLLAAVETASSIEDVKRILRALIATPIS